MLVNRRLHMFRVRADTLTAETLCVVGNCPELGSWMRAKAVHMNKDSSQRDVWFVSVNLPSDTAVEYRYFVCVSASPDTSKNGESETVVRYWETNPSPRRIAPSSQSLQRDSSQSLQGDSSQSNGHFDPNGTQSDQSDSSGTCSDQDDANGARSDCDVARSDFDADVEEFGAYNGLRRIEQGWLTAETVVLLKLYDNPLRLWKDKHKAYPLRIKVTPVSLEVNKNSGSTLESLSSLDLEDSTDVQELRCDPSGWPLIEVASMDSDQCQLHMQDQFGLLYQPDSFTLFRGQTISLENTAFLVDLYQDRSPVPFSAPGNPSSCGPDLAPPLSGQPPPRHLGFCYVLPSNLKNSCGTAVVPITSVRHAPIGELSVDYVVVSPMQEFECEMHESFARHWKHRKGLDVGHRGAGRSFKRRASSAGGCSNISNIRENTIASLSYAALHGADFVELDVQLSRDGVPVIYHDFHVSISMKHKNRDQDDQIRLPVKDLTLEQLHNLKTYSEGEHQLQFPVHDHLEDHQPFPTLEKALQDVEPGVGFNIEIKWTMKLKDGTFELYHPFELNPYLDTVLQCVLTHGGTRKIVFSCFHPDICHILRLKQNKYPVLFLTQGVTQKYPPYQDPRTHSIQMGINFALCAGILGINVHTEDILRDPKQVQMALDANLVLFCWGDDNNSTATIKYLKELGLHGIIYDRIDEFGDKKKEEEVFVAEMGDTQNELRKVAAESSSNSQHDLAEVMSEKNQVALSCI